jgi:4-diphosphocytidyl-2-C-methyl-D-erythritol kinase
VTDAAAAVGAQAKVNLFLHVLAREESGYHQIETLFCRLALADDVVVRVRASGASLDCDGTDLGPVEQNLAYRAAHTYASRRGWPPGFAIELTKRIPVGAGLGGGSADAGAVLRALQALDPEPPSAAALLAWGTDLGADVPAMTIESPLALGWARGDRLLTLPALPARKVMLYVPAVRVSTAEAYAWLADDRRTRVTHRLPARALDIRSLTQWDAVVPLMANDFAAVVGGRHAAIATMTDRMRTVPGCMGALMSGSGSVVFGLFGPRIPHPWPLAALEGGRFVATATADSVVGVRRIE